MPLTDYRYLNERGLRHLKELLDEHFLAIDPDKGLSTNDFTDEFLEKLQTIPLAAQENVIERIYIRNRTREAIAVTDKGVVIPIFRGATSNSDGSDGLVPAPDAGEEDFYLAGNGEWTPLPDIDLEAIFESPEFTGTPTTPTAPNSTNNNQVASTSFVHSLVEEAINNLPPSSKIGSTYYWDYEHMDYVPLRGEIIIYDDKGTTDDGESIPGIKIGDGMAYVVDLPFVGDDDRAIVAERLGELTTTLDDHINNRLIHITDSERNFWNAKLNCRVNDEETLIFNRQ